MAKKPKLALTDRDVAVLQAIEELGETATVGEIRKRARQLLKEMHAQMKKKPN